jgi:hypothetical protein
MALTQEELRRIDREVAEKVMGWAPCDPEDKNGIGDGMWQCACGATGNWSDQELNHYPPYSTSIEAAWTVVEQVRKVTFYDCFSLYSPTDESKHWFAHFVRKWHGRAAHGLPPVYDGEPGETAPHAICLAALKAVYDLR